MTLPRTTRTAPSPAQRERLARWLGEWQLLRGLSAEDGGGIALPAPRFGAKAAGLQARQRAGESVCPGDIRLLAPEWPSTWKRPRFLLVAEVAATRDALIIPFGPLSEPAHEGELRTRRDECGLRVLCLWNARWAPAAALESGWLIDRLPSDGLAEVAAARRAAEEGIPLTEPLGERVGPPLVHPLDPRHEYLARLADDMDELASDLRASAFAAGAPWTLCDRAGQPELAIAADRREPFGKARRYRVGDTGAWLESAGEADPGSQQMRVVAPGGRPTLALDGSVLRIPGGAESPPIAGGLLTLARGFAVESAWLVTPAYQRVPLIPE